MTASKRFIFLGGVHRSGTSLVHDILRRHPDISTFADTGKLKDEGQHLQSVYPPASAFGGPGRFAFHPDSSMDEDHPLASDARAAFGYMLDDLNTATDIPWIYSPGGYRPV